MHGRALSRLAQDLDSGESIEFLSPCYRDFSWWKVLGGGGLIVFLIVLGLGLVLGVRFWASWLIAAGVSGLVSVVVQSRPRWVSTRPEGGLLAVTDRRLVLMRRDGQVVGELPLAELTQIGSWRSPPFGTARVAVESAAGTDVLRLAGDWPKRTARSAMTGLVAALRGRSNARLPERSLLPDRPAVDVPPQHEPSAGRRVVRRVITSVALIAVGAATAVGGDGHHVAPQHGGFYLYPRSERAGYLRACVRGGDTRGDCACQFDLVRRYIPYDDYRRKGGASYFKDIGNLSAEVFTVSKVTADHFAQATINCAG
jgi:hypothetical protein